MDIVTTVTQFIVDQFAPDVDVSEIELDYDLLENAVVDSLGLLTVLAWLEDQFGADVDYGEIDETDFRSVRAICALIERTCADVSARTSP